MLSLFPCTHLKNSSRNHIMLPRMKAKQNLKNIKDKKRTRGYRLKPSTHNLIVKIQEFLQSDQDEAIEKSCLMFYNELQKKNNKIKK